LDFELDARGSISREAFPVQTSSRDGGVIEPPTMLLPSVVLERRNYVFLPDWGASIQGQPHDGLRRFISTMASASSLDGPLGPARRRRFGENSNRYLHLRKVRWQSRIVEGFNAIAERITRDGRMRRAKIPTRIRFEALRFGARCRERLRISSWCLIKRDSATTERTPPGPRSRASVTSK
jgi:hypothetical protein